MAFWVPKNTEESHDTAACDRYGRVAASENVSIPVTKNTDQTNIYKTSCKDHIVPGKL